ncbi:MAG: AsmA-like C-terminal region-containing protein [Pseudomonadota bacterium]
MDNSVYHRLAHVLWVALVSIIVLLAVYVSFGRLLLANVSSYQEEILWELNQRGPVTIEAEAVLGKWRAFSPVLVFKDVVLSPRSMVGDSLALKEGRLTLDVWHSLRTRSLKFVDLELDGLRLHAELDSEGRFAMRGFAAGEGDLGPWLQGMLLNIESMAVAGVELQLALPEQQSRSFALDLNLEREGSQRWLQAGLLSSEGTSIQISAQGRGNPFDPSAFAGLVYLDFDLINLEQLGNLLPPALRQWRTAGAVDIELWFNWDRGDLRSEGQFSAADLVVADAQGSWEVPLDSLSLQTSVIRGANRWTVFTEELEVLQGEVTFSLPKLQLDAWGDSLRLRAAQLPIAPLNQLVVASGKLPQKLQDVLETLNLGGYLPQVELNIADLAMPAQEWLLEANFEELAVDSWRGAPGVRSGRGHVDLGPGGGTVIIDSQQFSMAFPRIYAEPLYYDDFHGSVDIRWDTDTVSLQSGPVTASGVEGTAQALLGLNIPLKPTAEGIEMDLMVGLTDSYPIYRTKYLPYILPDTLQNWLRGSIGEGRIEQGAFLWRGSLRRGVPDLRTIQLFFNLADTRLEYHPDWPAASNLRGTVLIDDLNVSVWAERARLLGSDMEHLSVEAWRSPERQMMLAVSGEVQGSASDGLAAVNASPLSALVGDAFSGWQASGDLHTSLNLLLNLAEPRVPKRVDVATRWSDVAIDIQPGGLRVTDIDGELFYDSREGFSSAGLSGSLWDKPLTAELLQAPAARESAVADGPLEIRLQSSVAMADVGQWLSLDALAFASGESAVEAVIGVTRGEATSLTLASQLQGIALDLPEPWAVASDEIATLSMQTTLGREPGPLSFALNDELHLDLLVDGARFAAASLSFNEQPAALRSGALVLSGRTPELSVAQWLTFVGDYFASDPLAALSADGEGLVIAAEALRADNLEVYGRSWQDVMLDLRIDGGDISAGVSADWLQAKLELPASEQGTLAVSYLDLAGLGLGAEGMPAAEAEEPQGGAVAVVEEAVETVPNPDIASIPELPPLRVDLAGLHQGERSLGDVAFELSSQPGLLQIEKIQGDLSGLRLRAEEPARLTWRAADGATTTELQGRLFFDDLGSTLQAFGYEKSLETAQGEALFALAWPGGPQDFGLASASGTLELDARNGRFLNTDAGTSGALRVISVLNMADLIGRLSLNEVFETGVPFHTMGGRVELASGVMVVDDFQVLGSSSSFDLSAQADLRQETLDGELIVTLPLASNLPWVAALAAASWPVAAGVFVVGKMFEEQFNRLSSGVYSVSGSWTDPELVLTRAFDNTPSAPEDEAAEQAVAPVAEQLAQPVPDSNS